MRWIIHDHRPEPYRAILIADDLVARVMTSSDLRALRERL
jgi:hypothetical protein